MNKRGLIKWGICSVLIIIFSLFIFSIILSSAQELKQEYKLGETIRFDLEEDSNIKITTPSEIYIKKASGVFFLYLDEIGDYQVEIKSDNYYEKILFFVVSEKEIISEKSPFSFHEGDEKPEIDFEEDEENNLIVEDDFFEEEIYFIEVGKPVRNTKTIDSKYFEKHEIKIPKVSENLSVYGNADYYFKQSILDFFNFFSDEKSLIIENAEGIVQVNYYTPGPEKTEKDISRNRKEVVVSSDIHYENVLAYTYLEREIPLKENVKIYWKEKNEYLDFELYDTNGNGLYDYVEWIVPHLSTQTFEIIIEIKSAEHLDSNRNFISDIYDLVKEKDDIWVEIREGEYLRIEFEEELTNKNDITIFPRIVSGNPRVEVYEIDSDLKIAEFRNIVSNEYNKVYLKNLLSESQDSFDLRVVGGSLEFDYVFDPYYEYVINFTSSTSWVIPPKVTKITVETWAGGAGGGSPPGGQAARAGGGGGGAYARANLSVTPGQNYSIAIGIGGSAGTSASNGGAGGNTSFYNSTATYVRAVGGSGGTSGGVGGAGGSAGLSIGDVTYKGGDGGTVDGTWSGGGGGGAGSTGAGGNANIGSAGTGTSELGGDGGAGLNANSVGNPGSIYGGAGSGGRKGTGGAVDGGAGAQGFMRITYRVYYNLDVILNYPENHATLDSYFVSFNFTPDSSDNFINCSLWDDSTGVFRFNQTNQTAIINGTDNFINKTYALTGTYLWNIQCCDDFTGCVFATSNYTLTIYEAGDLDVFLDSPSPNQILTSPDVDFYFTPTSTGNLLNCSLWDNSTGVFHLNQTNQTAISEGSSNFIEKTYSQGGTYLWNIQCCDDENGCVFSVTNRSFSFDFDAPVINLVFPENGGNFLSFDDVFVYNVSDASPVNNCSLYINGGWRQTNTSITRDTNQTFYEDLENGIYNWSVSCTDSGGRTGWSVNRSINVSIPQEYVLEFSSSETWTVPKKIVEIVVEAWGAGGAGGGLVDNGYAGGGGGGAFARKTFSVSEGQVYELVVAEGASAGTGSGANGSATYFDDGSELYAEGGRGGLSAGTGGVGGRVANSRGDDIYAGGNGGTSTAAITGAGGGGAGNQSAGGNASAGTAGRGGNYSGGDGAAGRSTVGPGSAGNPYGGGGSGARRQGAPNQYGGAGGEGFMRIIVRTYRTEFLDVFLNYPQDDTILDSYFVSFNFTSSSSGNLLNCSLWDNSTGVFHLNQTNQTAIIDGADNFINKTYSQGGTYLWNIQCCDDNEKCSFASENYTFSIDVDAPVVNLVFPADGATISDDSNFFFRYNVSDASSVHNCSLYVNNEFKQIDTSITKDINMTFYQYLEDGLYNWSVSCSDATGRIGWSANRTINISVYREFVGVLYESFPRSFSEETAYIYLKNERDDVENNVSYTIPIGPSGLTQIVEATSGYMGYNGAFIPAGSRISFSGAFSSFPAIAISNIKITWKLYVTNSSGDSLICQVGDDSTGGITAASTTSEYRDDCISSNLYLFPGDKLKLVINAYNEHASDSIILNHFYDHTASYVAVNVISEGFLNVDLVSPLADPNVAQGGTFEAICQVDCSIGNCTNVNVYIQRNTSTTGWTDIGADGNLILNDGETNPHNFNKIGISPQNTTFIIEGNLESDDNNIRCIAIGSYDNYNGTTTTPVTVGVADAAPPVINLTSPATMTWFNYSTVSLFYNISDVNDNIANSTLILNGERNITNQTPIINNQINNFTITLPDGAYNWSVNATDTTNLEGASDETRIFYIDTRAPTIELYLPHPDAYFEVNTVDFYFNASDNLASTLLCNLTVDDSIRYSNFPVNNGENISRSVSELGIGVHYWNVTCFDLAGNYNTSETRNFSIADLPPEVFLITPNNWWFNESTISLIYNASDNNDIARADLYLNGIYNQSNQTPVLNHQYNNFTLTLADGYYNWTVNVTDTSGYNATAPVRFFYVDTQKPNIILLFPIDNFISYSSSLNFEFNATDNLASQLLCNLTIGDKTDYNIPATNGANTSRPITGLTDGVKIWNVSCVDSAGHSNISVNRQITIEEAPRISLNTGNLSWFKEDVILEYTPSDNTNFSNCSLYIDGSLNATNYSVANNQLNNFVVNGLSNGFYNWSVTCFDTYGLSNNSETRFFYRDNEFPQLVLHSPEPDEIIYSADVYFNFTVTDNMAVNLTCNLTINDDITELIAQNGTLNSISKTLSADSYSWNVSCSDYAGNINHSETRSFTTITPPYVELVFPEEGEWLNYTSVNFSYYANKYDDSIVNCSLYINGEFVRVNSTQIDNDFLNYFNETLEQGEYEWNVYCVDADGLTGSGDENLTFYIDLESPEIILYTPEPNETLDWNSVNFSFIAVDNMAEYMLCDVFVNNFPLISNLNVSNSSLYSVSRTLDDGFYNWSLRCRDSAQNSNWSEERNFTVDAPPKINLLTPDNDYYGIGQSVTFSYLAEDAQGIANCTLFINDEKNATKNNFEFSLNPNFTISGIPEGRHNWTVECFDNDAVPRSTKPFPNNFTMDFTPPEIELISPENEAGIYYDALNNRITFYWLAVDLLDRNLRCNLTVSNQVRGQANKPVTSNSTAWDDVDDLSFGVHYWNVTCADRAGNRNTSLTYMFNHTYPDFMINESLIDYNQTEPKENELILINATVYNLGGADANNVVAQFYNGDPDSGGDLIASRTFNISKYGTAEVNATWSASIGTSQIFVIIDPPLATNGSFQEWNETNNKAYKQITVGSWHFFAGNIMPESEFKLADNSSVRLISWNSTNFQAGNIYVADSESTISWYELKAIGRTIAGAESGDDFAEIDTLLGMTGFDDSVYNVFTDSGVVKNTTDIIVFNRIIYNVPVAESINNSNFTTGILWDSSKDTGDEEFDADDKEDLVFVSPINRQKQGSLGIYDYEMRVPAKLREYIEQDSNRVFFYVELR